MKDQFDNSQKNSQKYEKSYDSNFHDYDNINNIDFVNKGVEHFYNKCDISFLSKNKLFKHLREIYQKFKIYSDAAFEAFDATFQINETSFAAFIINNAEIVTIIHFIAELCDTIVKSSYNFHN